MAADKALDRFDREILPADRRGCLVYPPRRHRRPGRTHADSLLESASAAWSRTALILRRVALLDPGKVGLPVSVSSAEIETADHSSDWLTGSPR